MGPTDESRPDGDVAIPASTAAPSEQPVPAPTPASESAVPDPTPTPAPTLTPDPVPTATPDPAIAETISIPADSTASGGEWELLVEKVQGLVNADQLKGLWNQWKLPVRLLGGVIVLILVLQVYGGIIRTIAAVPLAPGLLELVGLIWLANFSTRNLIRNSDRANVIANLRERWNKVVGR
ncbi:MAG: CAAD domain-containing protein [Cyanobacteriota bacterium]|nr:CAAD domain-containing protein [Cyanobacteriota bacterium]